MLLDGGVSLLDSTKAYLVSTFPSPREPTAALGVGGCRQVKGVADPATPAIFRREGETPESGERGVFAGGSGRRRYVRGVAGERPGELGAGRAADRSAPRGGVRLALAARMVQCRVRRSLGSGTLTRRESVTPARTRRQLVQN